MPSLGSIKFLLILIVIQICSAQEWRRNSSSTTTTSVYDYSTTDYYLSGLAISLNWLTIPIFVFFMVLGVGCWYRRYRFRQQYLANQRLNGGAAVQYNSAMGGVAIPQPSNSNNQFPANAYPRQQIPNAYSGPQPVQCPPYQAADPASITVQSPPSYEDAIKQPVPSTD